LLDGSGKEEIIPMDFDYGKKVSHQSFLKKSVQIMLETMIFILVSSREWESE
jgi:hypothetical protein